LNGIKGNNDSPQLYKEIPDTLELSSVDILLEILEKGIESLERIGQCRQQKCDFHMARRVCLSSPVKCLINLKKPVKVLMGF